MPQLQQQGLLIFFLQGESRLHVGLVQRSCIYGKAKQTTVNWMPCQ